MTGQCKSTEVLIQCGSVKSENENEGKFLLKNWMKY